MATELRPSFKERQNKKLPTGLIKHFIVHLADKYFSGTRKLVIKHLSRGSYCIAPVCLKYIVWVLLVAITSFYLTSRPEDIC